MIVDATWPLATKGMGTVVNERFVLGEDHRIACVPIKTWVVPEEGDPQEFKDAILKDSFTPEEIAHREEFIKTLGLMTNSRWIKFLLWLERFVKKSWVTASRVHTGVISDEMQRDLPAGV